MGRRRLKVQGLGPGFSHCATGRWLATVHSIPYSSGVPGPAGHGGAAAAAAAAAVGAVCGGGSQRRDSGPGTPPAAAAGRGGGGAAPGRGAAAAAGVGCGRPVYRWAAGQFYRWAAAGQFTGGGWG
jgi:hypothetical protein